MFRRTLNIIGKFTLIICLFALTACQSQGGSFDSHASDSSRSVTASIARADTKLGGMQPTVDALTPDNLPASKATLTAGINGARADLAESTTLSQATEKASKRLEEENGKLKAQIAELTKRDPVKTWLTLAGVLSVIVPLGVLIASFAIPFIAALLFIRAIRSVAIGFVIFGFALLTIAHFLTQIYWIVGLSLLGAGIAYGISKWSHRGMKIDDAKYVPATIEKLASGWEKTTATVTYMPEVKP